MRHLLILVFVLLPTFGQSQSLEERLSDMEAFVDQIVATDTPSYSPVLIATIIADLEPDHGNTVPLANKVMHQLANLYGVPARSSVIRVATKLKLVEMFDERTSTERAAELFAHYAYYGKNCYGGENAVHGIFGIDVTQADPIYWVAIGVLTKAPTRYLRYHETWRDRVQKTIETLENRNLLPNEDIEDLRNSTLPAPSGAGCRD